MPSSSGLPAFPPPPPTRTVEVVDDFFGTKVADPYRWLEADSDAEVAAWVLAQQRHARAVLDALPGREAIARRLGELAALPRSGAPVHRGGRWFRTGRDADQQQDVLRVADTPTDAGTVLLDPHPLADPPTTSLGAWSPSPSGRYVAHSWIEAGSDWQVWRVRDVATGEDLPDVVRWGKFTVAAWLPDESGFVYGGYAPPAAGAELTAANRGHRVLLHRLGEQDGSGDRLLLETPDDPDLTFWPAVTADGAWLVIVATRGTEHESLMWVAPGDEPEALRPLITEATAEWDVIGHRDGALVAVTDLDAPTGRLVALEPHTGAVRELVGARDDLLEAARLTDDGIVLQWLRRAQSVLTRHAGDGAELTELPLPGPGTVVELSARPGQDGVFAVWTSFTTPPVVVRLDPDGGAAHVQLGPTGAVLSGELVTEQLEVVSTDGTAVPVFLTHRTDIVPQAGPHAALLYGYGGFRVPVTPRFDPMRALFVELGGVLAVPNLRGGGEFGAAWHDAGRRDRKQQVFDDAIAVAERLIADGWTSSERLVITGGSNGGLLAAAVLTQRPDLLAAAVPEVGVHDMLRFLHFTIGWAWVSDYGDPTRSPQDFATAYAYSPLHAVRDDVALPPVLLLTSDHDDRVVPAHSFKLAARLQAAGAPALLRVEIGSGHGVGRARDAVVAERTDVLAFVAAATGLRLP